MSNYQAEKKIILEYYKALDGAQGAVVITPGHITGIITRLNA